MRSDARKRQQADRERVAHGEVAAVLGYYGADEYFDTSAMASKYIPLRDELIDALADLVLKGV